MRIGITTDSSRNPYAAALILALSDAGVTPVSLISTEKSANVKLIRELKNNGVSAVVSKVSDRFMSHANNQQISNTNLVDLCCKKQIDMKRFTSVNKWETVQYVREYGLDVLINAGGGIFRKAIVEAPIMGILNAHMGPLPEIRGMNALEWSLYLGMKPGVTLHFIDTGIDTGDILLFREIEIESDDTIESLRMKSLDVSVGIMVEGILGFVDGSLERQPQRPNDGKQYFVMHERLKRIVQRRISADSSPISASDDKSDNQLSLL